MAKINQARIITDGILKTKQFACSRSTNEWTLFVKFSTGFDNILFKHMVRIKSVSKKESNRSYLNRFIHHKHVIIQYEK